MTAPAYACPTSTTGPSIRSRVRSREATSSSSVVKGTGTVTALIPFDWSPIITLLQLDPSAHAPGTNTNFHIAFGHFLSPVVMGNLSGAGVIAAS